MSVYVSELQTGYTRLSYRVHGDYSGLCWLAPDKLSFSFNRRKPYGIKYVDLFPGKLGSAIVLLRASGGKPRVFGGFGPVSIASSDGSGFIYYSGKDRRLHYYDVLHERDVCVDPLDAFSHSADRFAYLVPGQLVYVRDWSQGELVMVDWQQGRKKTFAVPNRLDEMRISPDRRHYWSHISGYSTTFENTAARLYLYELPREAQALLHAPR